VKSIRIEPRFVVAPVRTVTSEDDIAKIINAWEKEFGIELSAVIALDDGKKKTRDTRRALFFKFHTETNMNYSEIGRITRRSSSSVLDGVKREMARRKQNDK